MFNAQVICSIEAFYSASLFLSCLVRGSSVPLTQSYDLRIARATHTHTPPPPKRYLIFAHTHCTHSECFLWIYSRIFVVFIIVLFFFFQFSARSWIQISPFAILEHPKLRIYILWYTQFRIEQPKTSIAHKSQLIENSTESSSTRRVSTNINSMTCN